MTESFLKLVKIVKKLRSPDGCPWDKEQNLYSIKDHFLEEAYELIEALDRKDVPNIREELGDVFFHVIFHAEMAESENLFNLKDVIEEISEKLIRRHPHVFANDKITESEDVITRWEEIKKEEKKDKNIDEKSILDGVPTGLTPLLKSEKIQKKAAKTGFDWEKQEDCMVKVEEEFSELKEAITSGDREEMLHEMGDMFFSLVNLSRFLGVSADEAMRLANERFTNRFKYIEHKLNERGEDIYKTPLEEMEKLWQESKKRGR